MKKATMRQGEGLGKKHHDALLKSVFSIPVHAQSLLRDQLPKEIVKLLADKPPKIVGDSFVNENLLQSQADLLMEVEMASGEPGLVYVLVEHKSYSDGEAALQMLSYMVRIWQRHVNGGGKGRARRAGADLAASHSVAGLLRYATLDRSDEFCGHVRDR